MTEEIAAAEKIAKEVKTEVLGILKETIAAFEEKRYAALKEISYHTTHTASIYQDKDSVSIAVIVYALFKIMGRVFETETGVSATISRIPEYLKDAQELLEQDKIEEYRKCIGNIISSIAKADNKINLYIQETIKQAQIKKGSRLYEHGISAARVAEILGITQWELMPYIGKTTFSELRADPARIMKRVEIAREVFKVKN